MGKWDTHTVDNLAMREQAALSVMGDLPYRQEMLQGEPVLFEVEFARDGGKPDRINSECNLCGVVSSLVDRLEAELDSMHSNGYNAEQFTVTVRVAPYEGPNK